MKDKKDEYWKRDKNFIQRLLINFRVWNMKMMGRTHGTGIILYFLIFFMIFSLIDTFIIQRIVNNDDKLEDFKKRVICMEHNYCMWGV